MYMITTINLVSTSVCEHSIPNMHAVFLGKCSLYLVNVFTLPYKLYIVSVWLWSNHIFLCALHWVIVIIAFLYQVLLMRFQTSLLLAALLLRRVTSACCFMVYSSQRPRRFGYHRAASLLSWTEVNCMRSAAVGKASMLSIYWQDTTCRSVIPLQQVALAQLYKYHLQSGNAASGKLVWKHH